MPFFTVYGHDRPKCAAISVPAKDWRDAALQFKAKYPTYRIDQWEGPKDSTGEIAGCCEGCGLPLDVKEPHLHRDGADGVWCEACFATTDQGTA